MLTIARLFCKSPFSPIQTHMDKVALCLSELPALFQAMLALDAAELDRISRSISHLEHEADLTKNDIRNHLPKSLFLPMDRGAILEILSLQDALADQAEKIATRAGMRPLELLSEMRNDFSLLCQKNMEVFWLVRRVIQELEDLLACSFGGMEAEKVKGMVDRIAYFEYETTQIQNRLIKTLYREGDCLPVPAFHLALTLIEEIGCLAKISEQLGNRIRMLLELR